MSSYFGRDISEVHCCFCGCPKEIWKPLDNYLSDNSCEFYIDVDDIADRLENLKGVVTRCALLDMCQSLRNKYSDIMVFEDAVNECFDIFADLGTHKTRNLEVV